MKIYIKPDGKELKELDLKQVLMLVPFSELFLVEEDTAEFTIEHGNTIELHHVDVEIDEHEVMYEIIHALEQYAILNP